MSRPCVLALLALPTFGCGARSELLAPPGSSSDPSGSPAGIYVTDEGPIDFGKASAGRLVRFSDMSGGDWTVAPAGSPDPLEHPTGLAVGAGGTIYYTDTESGRVLSMDDMSGAGLAFFEQPDQKSHQYTIPAGLALDGEERIYVADSGANRVTRMDDMAGAGWVTFGQFGLEKAEFNSPRGVAISSKGQILVADYYNHRIVQMDDMSGAGWIEWVVEGTPEIPSTPASVAYDSQDRIYVIDSANNVLHRLDSIGGGAHVQINPVDPKQLDSVTVGPDGRIYLTFRVGYSGDPGVVRMDDMNGAGIVVLGSKGTGDGQFLTPSSIVVK